MKIEKHITLEAIPARVYDAFTKGTEITRWFCDLAQFDLKKDARVEFVWKQPGSQKLHPQVMKCEIEDFIHCKKLDMACQYGSDQGEVKVLLRPEGLKTKLTVIHDGIENPERACKTDAYWDENLRRLKNYIEQSPRP